MDVFEFDEKEDFSSNLDSFLKNMADEDQEMTEIFRKHMHLLEGVNNESERRSAITKFNENVMSDLEALRERDMRGEK